MQIYYNSETERINNIINSFNNSISFVEFLEKEVKLFLASKKRNAMLVAQKYYQGKHDILKRKRTVIGQNGEMEEIFNLPNNHIVDNQYARLVDQKNGYILGKPLTFYSENFELLNFVQSCFGKKFFRLIKNIGEDSINCGLAWLYIFVNEQGELDFKRFRPFEILPFWNDEDHTKLDMLLRIYDIEFYQKNCIKVVTQVEAYTKTGIQYYIFKNGKLFVDHEKNFKPYIFNSQNQPLKWDNIPIIPFKSNSQEIPLIKKVKSLQDALNTIRSDFMNNVQEDARNTILVLKNYDGTNLSEFRKNLSEYGVVKVKTIDGSDGGVEALKIEVDSSKYESLIRLTKKAIVENARGYDSRDEKVSSNPNQMNIQSMYADIELDAGLMEVEFQASFEQLFWFFKCYLSFAFNKDFFKDCIEVIFNRDVLINETEAINNCVNSIGILSNETIIKQHPWVEKVELEINRLNKQN